MPSAGSRKGYSTQGRHDMAVPTDIVIATIAAVPPTLAALAAWRKATIGTRQVTPSNGTKLSTMVEMTYDLVRSHITDPDAHGRFHVCQNCLSIEENGNGSG